GRDRGPPTRPRHASTPVLCFKGLAPIGEPLLRESQVLALDPGKPAEVPPFRVGPTQHDHGHALARSESQGTLRLEQTIFVKGFDRSHALENPPSAPPLPYHRVVLYHCGPDPAGRLDGPLPTPSRWRPGVRSVCRPSRLPRSSLAPTGYNPPRRGQ